MQQIKEQEEAKHGIGFRQKQLPIQIKVQILNSEKGI